MRKSYLCNWYWKVKQRRGAKKAIIALARKVLVIIYSMLKSGKVYDETVFDYVKQNQEALRLKKVISEAKKLGLEVIVPQSA